MNVPDSNINICKILEYISVTNVTQLKKKRESLTEEEKKVYDICTETFKNEKQKHILQSFESAIHEQASQEEPKKYRKEIGGVLFEEKDKLYTDEIPSIVEQIKTKVNSAVGKTSFLDSIVKKIEKHVEPSNLSSHFENVIEIKETYDDYLHRIFLTTNELDQGFVEQELQSIPVTGNTFVEAHHRGKAVIAVSGFCGLNLASVRGEKAENEAEIDTIIMIDRSNKVQAFWEEMAKIITSSKTRQEVIEKIYSLVKTDIFKVDDYDTDPKMVEAGLKYFPKKHLDQEINRNLSWLSSVERFKKIKSIFDNGRFIFKRVDLTNEDSMNSLQKALQESNCTLDTLYVSNIAEYLEEDGEFQSYKKGILNLIDDQKTLLVDSALNKGFPAGIKQRLFNDPKEQVEQWGVKPNIVMTNRVKRQ